MNVKFYLVRERLISFCFLFFVALTPLVAQEMQIRGTVTDTQNEPLMGVSVIIVNSTVGTTTNLDGEYTLSARKGDVLRFSYLGMSTTSIQIGDEAVVDVVMQEDVTMLEEVVAIGYGTARKRDLTGSIASISAEDIANRPSANPMASLQGKVAGMQVVNTGRAGQDPEIRIRGTNSITGYAPTYVVDGMFTDNINHINPSDIVSVEVLKDASSLAIFGVRGANGVIIITTKQAKRGETLVSINSSVGFKDVRDRISITNAGQFKELYTEQLENQQATPFTYDHWQADTDWQDEIFQTGFMTINNISVMGTTDKSRFYLGIGYTKEEGSIKHEELSRYSISMNSDYDINKHIRLGYQISASRTLPPDAKSVEAAVRAAPIAPVYGTYVDPETATSEVLYHILPDFQSVQLHNPMLSVEAEAKHARATNNRVSGNVFGEVNFLNDFNFKSTFYLDYQSNESRRFSPFRYVYNPVTDAKENLTTYQTVSQTKMNRTDAQVDLILTYDKSFGDHNLTATLGMTSRHTQYSTLTAGRQQDIEDDFIIGDNPNKWWISSLDQSSSTNSGDQYTQSTLSYLMRALYSYKSRYLLNLSYRRDGASVFQNTGHVWDNFYSVGAGWVISEEDFMKSNDSFLDFLKLKGSWGILGNPNIGTMYYYPGYPVMLNGASAVFGDKIITGYRKAYLVKDLEWEKTHTWEVGFEAYMFRNRLRFEPVYYNKLTKDMMAIVEGISGSVPGLQSIGELQNKGFELTASWNDRIGRDWSYGISANLNTLDSEMKSLIHKDYSIYAGSRNVARTVEGYPIGYFYGYEVEGVYQNYEDIKQSPSSRLFTVQPGDLKYRDLDGDGLITTADRTKIGDPTPDFTYGFQLSLKYRDIDLSADFMGVYGNETFRAWDLFDYAQYNYRTERLARWNGEGSSNWEPILDPARANNKENSNYFIEDGSFFRIKNIQLGYSFKPEILKKIYVNSLRLYANVQNLMTWRKNIGYTPELGGSSTAFGIDNGSYPMPAIYTFGVNLTF